ncbi:MAG: cytochrome b/b6 domain-containing protein [Acidobacteriaceae bacterium]|nr:cytochrome b/b6 domain-containing protein [Acidobacteriaceae bacterium]MBV9767183.1 cytochrome b/b6 domain-containing protein [Acidobacteriaceae bacterium]
MQKLKLKHLVAIRWFHWINFPLLFLMIWSGFLIYWAYPVYHIGPVRVVPNWIYQTFHWDHRLADGMALHFFFMWLFILNGILYVSYTIFSGEWRLLVPRSLHTFQDAWHVALYDLHLRKERPTQTKYNAAQQLSYTGIVVMGIGSVLTGLAIYKPAQLAWLAALFGGYQGARLMHFGLTVGYLLFFVVHVVQVILAGWNNFRSMVIGYELVDQSDGSAH